MTSITEIVGNIASALKDKINELEVCKPYSFVVNESNLIFLSKKSPALYVVIRAIEANLKADQSGKVVSYPIDEKSLSFSAYLIIKSKIDTFDTSSFSLVEKVEGQVSGQRWGVDQLSSTSGIVSKNITTMKVDEKSLASLWSIEWQQSLYIDRSDYLRDGLAGGNLKNIFLGNIPKVGKDHLSDYVDITAKKN